MTNANKDQVADFEKDQWEDRGRVRDEYAQVASRVSRGEGLGVAETNHAGATDERCVYDEELTKDVPEKSLCCCRGCANPFNRAELQEGMKVLDLGCGAGTDCFIAAKKVGDTGKVVGLDMTQEMIDVANESKEEAGVKNVEFIKGYLEELPFEDGTFDFLLSNCVINLCKDKTKVLREANRVLKKGGMMVATDLVAENLPPDDGRITISCDLLGATEGVMLKDKYEKKLVALGFNDVDIEEFEVYSSCALKQIAKDKGMEEFIESGFTDEFDNVFASCYVKAKK